MKKENVESIELRNIKLFSLYDDLEVYEWIYDHLDEYVFLNEAFKIKEKFHKYEKNKNTYYIEMIKVYEELVSCFYFDIYCYVSGEKSLTNAKENIIYATYSESYLINIEDKFFPIGFLRQQVVGKSEYEKDILKQVESYKKKNKINFETWKKNLNTKKDEIIDLRKEYIKTTKASFMRGFIATILMIIGIIVFFYFHTKYAWSTGVILLFVLVYLGLSFIIFQEFKASKYIGYLFKMEAIYQRYCKIYEDILVIFVNLSSIFVVEGNNKIEVYHNEELHNEVKDIYQKDFRLKFKIAFEFGKFANISLIIILIIVSLLGRTRIEELRVSAMNYEEELIEEIQSNDVVTEDVIIELTPEGFDLDGFLFPDSAGRFLSKAEIEERRDESSLNYKDFLGYARNEIFARWGYPFKEGGVYHEHYSNYDWYKNMKPYAVVYNEFNKYEKENVNLIIELEKENGFK